MTRFIIAGINILAHGYEIVVLAEKNQYREMIVPFL